MFSSIGKLIYSENPYKLIVEVDDEIGRYYRSFIPKPVNIKRPLYPSHISVIRNEIPILPSYWKRYHNQEIKFDYEHYIYNGPIYYWLNIFSVTLEDIRDELGLDTTSQYTKSPDGRHKFHITIGNTKHLL